MKDTINTASLDTVPMNTGGINEEHLVHESYQVQQTILIPILGSVAIGHLLNDTMQAVLPAMFPLLHETLHLTYTELGVLAFANSFLASLIQPFIGTYTDKYPKPRLLPSAMVFFLIGMTMLAFSTTMVGLTIAVLLCGIGSAIFHPEGSRIVALSSGNRVAIGQSWFQIGGNTGQALAPLIAIALLPLTGQRGALLFTAVAFVALALLWYASSWHKAHLESQYNKARQQGIALTTHLHRKQLYIAFGLVIMLAFARSWYFVGITNYYALYQIKALGAEYKYAQMLVFVFMAAAAVGTLFGGKLSELVGMKRSLMMAMMIASPLTIALPYTSGLTTAILLGIVGFVLLATFSVGLSYAMELLPGQVGKVSGFMFGVAFGMGALGSLGLGKLADATSISFMMTVCSIIPLAGLAAIFLPHENTVRAWHKAEYGRA